ncbi:MAG TPA: hypothetical protein VFZ61_23030, partial [Polyangiales bacterium]
PSRAFAVMLRTGILEVTFPALAQLPPATHERSFLAVDAEEARGDTLLRLAALLWPLVGQPETLRDWLTQYRFSNQERDRLMRLVRHARVDAHEPLDDVALRRLAHAVERPHLGDVGRLSALLACAHHGPDSGAAAQARELAQQLEALAQADVALSQKELAVTGNDLMRELGLAPGPKLGQLLAALLDRVLEEPALNRRHELVELARGLL